MTKNINSNSFTSTNKNNKKKNVKNDSVNNVDKIMEELYTELNSEEMNMEQFQKVLEQLADHSLPESQELPLVQKLNQEHAKEDNCLEDVIKSQNNKTKFKNLQKKTNKLNNLINDNRLDLNSQQTPPKESHLQKLENYCDSFVNNNCTSTSLTNSLLNNCNQLDSKRNQIKLNGQLTSNKDYQNLSLINKESSQQFINNKECCDNLNCEHKKNRLLFNVSNTNEQNYEFKDYSRQASLIEYSSILKYADLKDNNDLNEHKLEPLIKNKDFKTTTSKLNYYDQSNQLKYNLVNTQFAEKILDDELKDSNRNYSSDCLNRYQTNLIDNQSHTKLSSSTSDGYISSMNTYFENDKSSNLLNSNYLKKGSTSIQTNGKSDHLKKRKKPEKKLAQDCQGYVGNLDVNFLTNYITGNKTADIRNQINSTNNTKEMNIKKKDKLNGNNLNKQKRNDKDDDQQSNDKNNNLTTASNLINIIPNSSINQSNDNQRKHSIDKITNENNQNMNNNQTNKIKLDKKNDKKIISSTNQSRKSSAASNLELNNQKLINQRSKDDKLNKNNAANTATNISSIVSNGLHGIDTMYIVSDSEVPDQEGDFKIVKYKNLRRKKQKKNNQDEIRLTSQQNKELIKKKDNQKIDKNKQNPATARGYESESDYCAVEGRKRELNLKRELIIDSKQEKDSISDSGSSINSQVTEENSNQQAKNQLNESSINTNKIQQTKTATFINQPQFTNPNVLHSKISTNPNKISYAAITKMNYSSTTALQTTTANKDNLINDNLTQHLNAINQETNKKEISKKKISVNKTTKSINLNEQNGKKADDKKSNDKQIDKQNDKLNEKSNDKTNDKEQIKPKKVIILDNSNLDYNEPKEFNYNLSDDNSRTITATSIDFQLTNSDSSSKTNSFSTTPPVIILGNKNLNQDTQFTFGFFDENDRLSSSNLEESNDGFKLINIDSVNFISNNKEPGNSMNSSINYQSNTSSLDTNMSTKNSDSAIDNASQNCQSTSSNLTTDNLSTNSDANITPLDNSTQFCQGTYIMNCDNNEDSSLRDNITRHVNTNDLNKSAGTLANEITSINLTKFIEKIPSPVISEVNYNQLNFNQQNLKYHKPEFTCNVAYIQAVNYIRRAWDDTISNTKPIRL